MSSVKVLKSSKNNLQMKKVIIFFVAVAFASKVNTQQPILPVINFDMTEFNAQARDHPQMHMQHASQQHMMPPPTHQQGRDAAENEPIVGSPLFGLGGISHPFHPLNPFGVKSPLGIPGLRFSNFQAGHLGNLHFGNTLLGAANPMANEELDQPMPPMNQQLNPQLGHPHRNRGAKELDQQVSPQVGAAPQDSEGVWPLWWLHLANPDSNLGASPQHMEEMEELDRQRSHHHHHHHFLGAPNMQEMNHDMPAELPPMIFPMEAPHFQVKAPEMMPMGPPMNFPMQPPQFQVAAPQMMPTGPPMPQQVQMQMEPQENARTWGKWGKGYGKGHDDSSE